MEATRYHRQTLLPQVGLEGQARIGRARVLLVGCGALGTVIAEQLVRAGAGMLRIADRDIVEMTNLQRQVLFDEQDVKEQLPKAIAASRRLARVNSQVKTEPLVVDVHGGNIEDLAGFGPGGQPMDLILDGTDNAQTRYLINDVSVKHGIAWVYGACVGTEGRCMVIRPPATACLRCLFPQPPGPGELATCDTAGVLASAAAVVASLQVAAALKLLVDDSAEPQLITLDAWDGRFRTIDTTDARRADCVCCGLRRWEFLDNPLTGGSVSLCGRNAVQVRPDGNDLNLNMDRMAKKLDPAGAIHRTPYLLHCDLHEPARFRLTIFPDGRAIVHGTSDTERARAIYARFVGT